jgi:hypothetical protein
MSVRFVILGFLLGTALSVMACDPPPPSDWALLSEDSEGEPTYIDLESIRRKDGGVAVYRRVVGEPVAADRVEFVQGLDCVNLRWAFFTLDESLLDSIAGTTLYPEEWSVLAFTPASRVLLDEVCQGFSPARWIRVLKEEAEGPGDLKEVWVDRETLQGPSSDTVQTELAGGGYSEEIFRSWSRWDDASPDSGYTMVQADVSCDQGALRYLESSRYSKEGEILDQAETPELWLPLYEASFERQVFMLVCEMGRFFLDGLTAETSPEGG